jgi:hypothetical protein
MFTVISSPSVADSSLIRLKIAAVMIVLSFLAYFLGKRGK